MVCNYLFILCCSFLYFVDTSTMSDNSMATTSSANSDHQTVSDSTHIETPSEDLEKDSDDGDYLTILTYSIMFMKITSHEYE